MKKITAANIAPVLLHAILFVVNFMQLTFHFYFVPTGKRNARYHFFPYNILLIFYDQIQTKTFCRI